MFSKIQDPLLRAFAHAIVGGFAGILFGFLFGLIVIGIGFLIGAGGSEMEIATFSDMAPPLMVCMGFGSMVGALLAGFVSVRSQK